jgi:hypothetical protein
VWLVTDTVSWANEAASSIRGVEFFLLAALLSAFH